VVLWCCGGGFIVAKQRAAMREGNTPALGMHLSLNKALLSLNKALRQNQKN